MFSRQSQLRILVNILSYNNLSIYDHELEFNNIPLHASAMVKSEVARSFPKQTNFFESVLGNNSSNRSTRTKYLIECKSKMLTP